MEGEMDLAANFLEDIEGMVVQVQHQDSQSWEGDPGGEYTVGSAYRALNQFIIEEDDERAFSILWKLKIPSKVSHFAWRLVRDRLPTRMNLRSQNVVTDEVCCPFCLNHNEDAGHLFFGCTKVMPLWWEILSWINTLFVFPERPKEHFLQHSQCILNGISQHRWQIWWTSLTWCTWNHRNRIVFSGDSFDGKKLMDDVLFFCWSWLKNLEKGFGIPCYLWSSNTRAAFFV